MQIRTRVRNGYGEGDLIDKEDNGLPYLITHAINFRRAIDIRCLPALMDENVLLTDVAPLRDAFRCTSFELGLVFRRRQDSARKTLILRQDM